MKPPNWVLQSNGLYEIELDGLALAHERGHLQLDRLERFSERADVHPGRRSLWGKRRGRGSWRVDRGPEPWHWTERRHGRHGLNGGRGARGATKDEGQVPVALFVRLGYRCFRQRKGLAVHA